ncbi:Linear gramicidin synthase subunit C OS=Brevibacillus parabrevis GN=lgrC PE=3 SV=1 [Rhizoctonia solani AG-1 IB]|uniref:Linear gramicidin synthase subunit C n=1 Tax=Thanatephorus cucumeris (strain AG1-IB / isolate 7/3/14) TaxID=1108050 RepID=A0A0B7FLE9_THACB|nr:Linear gramicidin synthase subunit C OS=Brevibacillus parabrevis GN=lgrC PE=3 SV=1 [Rhizoctonia solani AG-1 IB]
MCAAVWRQFVKYVVQYEPVLPSSLRLIVTGGESILTSVLKSWLGIVGEYPRFVNTYGPTEATVSTTMWEGKDGVDEPLIPIGRPLKDYVCYVLDPETNTPVTPGKDGVLFVSGPGVAIGYLDESLTRKKFIANPWANSIQYERMYNTGDLVRVDHTGIYWFRGRVDSQVRVCGYIVDLQEIEAYLLSHPCVAEAVIVTDPDEQRYNILSAYIVVSPSTDGCALSIEDLLQYCTKTLAHYEVPSRFYKVESIPLTLHQKVDRRALQALTAEQLPTSGGEADDNCVLNSGILDN